MIIIELSERVNNTPQMVIMNNVTNIEEYDRGSIIHFTSGKKIEVNESFPEIMALIDTEKGLSKGEVVYELEPFHNE
jgi:hypothetical protein